jgi:hypothetical protein
LGATGTPSLCPHIFPHFHAGFIKIPLRRSRQK